MAFKQVNARDIRNQVGMNGVPTDTTGAGGLDYMNMRWVRNDLSKTGSNTGTFGGPRDLMSAMSSMFDPNPRYQAIVDGYLNEASSWAWTNVQKPYLQTALTYTTPNGKKLLAALEGPNEWGWGNNDGQEQGGGSILPDGTTDQDQPSIWAGGQWNSAIFAGIQQWSQAIANFKSANTNLFTGTEVISLTCLDFSGQFGDYPSSAKISQYVDYGTFHYYTAIGGSQNGCFAGSPSAIGYQGHRMYHGMQGGFDGDSYALSMVISETGPYMSGVNWATDGVSQAWSAAMCLLDTFAMGGHRVLFFKMYDPNQTEFNYFTSPPTGPGNRGTPKPKATILRNIMSLMSLSNNYKDTSNLSDTGSFTPVYSPTNLSITLPSNDAPSAGSTLAMPWPLVLPKSDGSTMIAVWREPSIDTGNFGATTSVPTATSCTVSFGSSQSWKVWDPSGGTDGRGTSFSDSPGQISSGSGTSATFNLYGMPLFVELLATTVTSAPGQPTGLSVTSTTATRATVSWTLASQGTSSSPSAYVMQYQKGATTGTWLTHTTVGVSSNTFTYYGLDVSSQYFFRTIATNSVGSSTASASVSTTTTATQATAAPAVNGSNYSITREDVTNQTSRSLSLPANAAAGSGVLVTYSGFSGGGGSSNNITTTATNVRKLIGPQYDGTEEVMWAWRFTADGSTTTYGPFTGFRSDDHAGWTICEVVNWATEDISHGNVTTSTATAETWTVPTAASSNNITLAALSNTYAVTSFTGTNSSGTTVLTSAASSVSSYHQNALIKTVPGSLSLGITGGNTANTTAAYVNAIIYGTGVPAQITGVASSNLSAKQVTISWTTGGSGVSAYRVDISTNSGSSWTTVNQIIGSANSSYTVTGLTPSTSYQFSVLASNDSGVSTRSSAVSVTTDAQKAIQIIQSVTATDQSDANSITLTLTNAPAVGNYLFFYFIGRTGFGGPSIPSNAIYSSALSAGSNTDQQQEAWIIAASDQTKSWTLTNFTDRASAGVVEIQGVTSNDTPVVNSSVTYTNGSHIDPTITAPSDSTKAAGVAFIGMDVAPDSWGTMPTGLTLLQGGALSTYGSNQAVNYHTCAIFGISQSISSGTKQIPYVGNGSTQGGNPMMIAIEFIGSTSASSAPGSTTLTFTSITPTSISYSWGAASGTVTSYTIARSTVQAMTNPVTKSITGTSASDTGLANSTDYWFTITALNGSTAGTTSTAQKATTTASTSSSYKTILVGGKPFPVGGNPILNYQLTTPLSGKTWSHTPVTWTFGAAGTIRNSLGTITTQITDSTQMARVTSGLNNWATVSGVNLSQLTTANASSADIVIGYGNPSNVFGVTQSAVSGSNFTNVGILLKDPSQSALGTLSDGSLGYTAANISLQQLACHFFGLGLGLAEGDGSDGSSVMNSTLNGNNRTPDSYDIVAIQSLYGTRRIESAQGTAITTATS